MMNKTLFISLLFLFSFFLSAQAQVYRGTEADRLVEGAEMVRVSNGNEIPDYIRFRTNYMVQHSDLELYLTKQFRLNSRLNLIVERTDKDELGYQINRYAQTLDGFTIHDSRFIVLSENNRIHSIAGDITNQPIVDNQLIFTEELALNKALEAYPATQYKWERAEEEAHVKWTRNDPNASYYPRAEKVLFPTLFPRSNGHYRSCYVFEIFAHEPVKKARVFIDAESGEAVFIEDQLHMADVPATAQTKYSGSQEITTDSFTGGFRLRESGRGNGVETYNMQNGTSYGGSVDFTDSDNFWNNFNAQLDEVGTDAHWGAEMTYDYFYYKHNRNSIDNQGFKLKSYVHYNSNYSNAFWNGDEMTYGDGNGTSTTPFTALDICGHEIAHGLTSNTAALTYAYESGALNESFSDIFGTSIEFFAKPNQANWTVGEDIGIIIRSMSNPNAYGSPDTYQGNYWNFGSSDNGGVHTNSGVLNYWYYLLVVGGSGVNDNGNSYSVDSIGRTKADKIAYRTLVSHLGNGSQYADARFYSILSAVELYGSCSDEVEAVTKAWYAVGIGSNYIDTVESYFTAPITAFCEPPGVVHFTNQSINGNTFQWDFGDGASSTALNPIHQYNSFGTYNVTLTVDGGACGTASKTEIAFISIDSANICIDYLGNASSIDRCTGILYDNGGPTNYSDQTNLVTTIAPFDALDVTLHFEIFDFELDFDYLYIYDGPSTSSTLIGQYSGTALPNGGTITSSGSSITLKQTSDQYLTQQGFKLQWSCNLDNTPPICDFESDVVETCDGMVSFLDQSAHYPTSWFWDFGDGNTSNDQNPTHNFTNYGTFTVSLFVANSFGNDSLINSNMVIYAAPAVPVPLNGTFCEPSNVDLSAIGNVLFWYTDSIGGDLLHVGDTLTTPIISNNTNYWVSDVSIGELRMAGKEDNSGGGSFFTSAYTHHLVFDVYKPIKLVSVFVYAGSGGLRRISLNDASGTEIDFRMINIWPGESRILLDFDISPGLEYQLAGPESPDLFRNNGGTAYPYTVPGLLSVTHSSASTSPLGYYYYFYDWEVVETQCLSDRVSVLAELIDIPVSDFSYSSNLNDIQFTNLSSGATDYLWDFGDGSSSTDVDPFHVYTQVGTYTVLLIAENKCGPDTIEREIEISDLSISDLDDQNKVNIFPNPANESLTINFNAHSSGDLLVEIIDILGHSIILDHQTGFNGSYIKQFDMSQFEAGVYLISVRKEHEQNLLRLIISR
jgi:Zn-dependent metalloprotease